MSGYPGNGVPHLLWSALSGTTLLSICLWGIAGCAKPDTVLIEQFCAGEYGQARERLVPRLETDPGKRKYTIDRMRLGIVEMADGLSVSAEPTMEETYQLLRTQRLNADRTVSSIVINENVKRWKGEPFEQAMMYCYIGLQKALRGEWDNARAATENAIFMLRDFTQSTNAEDRRGSGLTKLEIATRSCLTEIPESDAGCATVISDGRTCVRVTEFKGARRILPATRTAIDQVVANEAFFQELHRVYDVSLLRGRTVNGEKAFVIQATVRQDRPAAGNRLVFCFSKATGLLLRRTIYLREGEIHYDVVYANHQINLELPDNRFDTNVQ